jgi:phosphoglycerate kinase
MRTYLVRINLDIKEKNVKDALRFRIAADAIQKLSTKNNKIVLLSHKGRPKGREKSLSLKPMAALLSKAVGKKVTFLGNLEEARKKVEKAQGGSVFLLENLRFFPGELKDNRKFAQELAVLGEVYINNDFATSHHPAASLTQITKFIPSTYGNILRNEIKELSRAEKSQRHPFVLVIGGAKVKDKAGVIKRFMGRADYILLGGGAANTFLKARGVDIKKSLYEPDMVKKIKRLAKSRKIMTPVDYVSENGRILDIGPETAKEYRRIIKDARTIIWAGPMGMFEKKKFASGNTAVAKAILSNKKAQTVIGGMETLSSLPIKVIKQKKGKIFFSTGGGAMLYFLAGKKLPAIEAIERKRSK